LLFSRYTGLLFSTQRSAKVPLPLVILGEAEGAKCLYKAVLKSSRVAQRDLRIAGIFADGAQERSEGVLNDTIVSDAKWAKSFAGCCEIHNGIVAVPTKCDPKTTELVKACAAIFRNLYIAPKILNDEVTAVVRLDRNSCLEIQVGGSSYFIENNSLYDSEIPDCGRPLSRQSSGEGHFLKRAVDVLGSLVVGLLTLPFLLLVAAAIVLTSKGSILYKQLRIGKGNRMFFALKFRTMFVDAHERLDHYLGKDTALREQWDSLHKLKNDPRVTFVGRFLRRFSLDELPQLWNVLVGDMSLIGPRPIIVSEIERYGRDYAAYEAVRPGLTGLWQVSGRNDTTYQERVDLDSYYVRNWSMGLDLRIFLKTFRAVISGLGAY
jgi:lipopolysaccharide/colanic/teichoic acid biosynthesis glycosyltransferase